MKAVILLSGGMDSATVGRMKDAEGWTLHGLTFSYGQRHSIELERARTLAGYLGLASHRIVPLPAEFFHDSSLTDPARPIPENESIGTSIPSTYVPARNLVFLSIAAALGETLGCRRILIGANAVDYSGYPDCRPLFIERMNAVIEAATKGGVEGRPIRVEAPLISMSKGEIVSLAASLRLDFRLTSSCYDPDENGRPCGRCDSCRLRARGFSEAGLTDPLAR